MVGLTDEEVSFYDRNGYLVVCGFGTEVEVEAMKEGAWRYARTLSASEVFTTAEQTRTTGDKFMDSANGIAAFLEEEAVDKEGKVKVPMERAINKVGHALHEYDPDVRAFTAKCGEIASSLSYEKPLVVQSMFIYKQPQIGGAVNEHRDSTFLWTDPPSCIAYWIALEDATVNNGCLMAVPGSHRDKIESRFIMKDGAKKPSFEGDPLKTYDESMWIPIEVQKGDLVLIHGSLCHRSAANRSDKTRLVYTFHVVEGASGWKWSEKNWLQRPEQAPFLTFSQL